ncbi:hypothetical protein COY23_00790 [bacterium (Candidatus Torokbacteria) CG_4_10_14_0_2_um_filter_35_8]|nr:MAG: hypothetical protein COY23_00790 [bacterium (Candidatus Torokbacteria) CG_4_10_14_0_2_um_filter_35_8]
MPTYIYQATASKGDQKQGKIIAASENAAIKELQERKLTVTSLKEEEKKARFQISIPFMKKIKAKDLVIFCKELAILVNTNLPIIRALKTIELQTENPYLKDIVKEVKNEVTGGSNLSDAFGRFPEVFSPFFINIVKSGEVSGRLGEILESVAEQMEKDYDLNSEVKTALAYPGFILVSIFVVGFILVTFALPQLISIFEESNVELPLTTRILIWVAHFMQSFWWLILAFIFLAGAFIASSLKSKQGQDSFDRLKLKLPIIGPLFQKVYLTRLTRNLGILIESSLPILRALKVTADVVGNVVYKEVLLQVADDVEGGKSIGDSFSKFPGVIPPLVTQMISVGEEVGKLDNSCKQIAEFFAKEVDHILKQFASLIEPVLLVVMGIAVGLLVSAILMPIYNLADTI